jgi:hypothetical protein
MPSDSSKGGRNKQDEIQDHLSSIWQVEKSVIFLFVPSDFETLAIKYMQHGYLFSMNFFLIYRFTAESGEGKESTFATSRLQSRHGA